MNVKHRAPFWDFDFRVFGEAFRQLRTVGILALVVMCLAAALLPIGVAIEAYAYAQPEMANGIIGSPSITRELVTMIQVHPLSLAPMYTLSLLMPLIGFSFLNKRRSSDFYHALPVSRAGVFISYFAAIMAWIVVDLLASSVVSVATLFCFPDLFQLVWSSVLPTLCASLAGALMVAGCMTFAMCITGTVFTNLLVAALLFFGPRILMWYISSLIQSTVDILPNVMDIPILNVAYNIPLGVLFGVLEGISTVNVLNNWTGCIYSAIIGVLYFIGALALYRTRHSEAAEQPAATPLLQTVYRLTLTFLVTLIPVYMIFESVQGKYTLDESECFGIFVLYILAALTFCIYELITTKKPKLLLKAAPTFLIVLVADVLLVGCLSLGVNRILAFRPTAEQIESVSFETHGYNTDNVAYFNSLTAEVNITDPATIRTVAEHLARAAEKNSPHGDLKADGDYECFNVTIRTKNAEKIRQLYFIDQQAEVIYKALQNNATYQAAYHLPTLNSDTQLSMWKISDEQAKAVYRVMCKDVERLPFETRYDILQRDHNDEAQAFTETVDISIFRYGEKFRLHVPLIAEYYPNAYKLYLQYIYENEAADRKVILEHLSQLQTKDFDLSMNLYSPDEGYDAYFDVQIAAVSDSVRALLANDVIPSLI
ncbi:MAG: hypothetical protein J6L00_04570, partial [Clostridia bacterium]|nr:hypothetical protein [Clostridia bacterium]